MNSISLCMIVKNEETVLARCLESAKGLVDEIIIVDTGSEDSTVEIARQYTDNIFFFKWVDDFADARNYAFSKATKDFIMWLDADDIITSEDYEKILTTKSSLDKSIDMVMMKYNIAFDEQGKPTFSYHRERIMRRAAGFLWEGAIHEVISPRGNIVYSEAAISHKKLQPSDPDRNLRIFENLLADGKELDARQQFYYARELSYHKRYDEAIAVLQRFLKEGRGWVENNITACMDLAAYYRSVGKEELILPSLCQSFAFDNPRAEVCCDIGQYFFDRQRYHEAIYWYKAASRCKRSSQATGFQQDDCYGFIPYMQLCVCYDKVGNLRRAKHYHRRAKQIKPYSQAVLYNEDYFSSLPE